MEGLDMKKVNESLQERGDFIGSTLSDIYSYFNDSKEQFNKEDLYESIDAIIEDLENLKCIINNFALSESTDLGANE